MNNIFPVFDLPVVDVVGIGTSGVAPGAPTYLPGPSFDVESGDFVFDSLGRAVYSTGVEAWRLWCKKAVLTQRFAHSGYSSDYGIEADEAFALSDRDAIESTFERSITEALMADPSGRTVAVRDFVFEWRDGLAGVARNAPTLHLRCTVVGIDGNTVEISGQLINGQNL